MINEWFKHIWFAYPYLLYGLLAVPVLFVNYLYRQRKMYSGITVSTTKSLNTLFSPKRLLRHIPFLLRLLALSAIIVALARPQTRNKEERIEGEGVDIVLCIDVSGSMLAEDFTPNRMEAAKNVAADFVSNRPADRIGLVIFAGESFTQCPITSDHVVLKAQIYNVRSGILQDGTAIGSGLATSVDRLKESKAVSKVVILLTDGENNGGLIDPKTAKEIAKAFKVRVYTIGIGTEGFATLPQQSPGGVIRTKERVNLDEKLLTEIAEETGGKYYRAWGNESLKNIYADIDRLEKSKIEVVNYTRYTEEFFPLVIIAVVLLLLEWVLRFTMLKKFP